MLMSLEPLDSFWLSIAADPLVNEGFKCCDGGGGGTVSESFFQNARSLGEGSFGIEANFDLNVWQPGIANTAAANRHVTRIAFRFVGLDCGLFSIGMPIFGCFEVRTRPLPSRFTQSDLSENWVKLLTQFTRIFRAGMLEVPVFAVNLQK